MCSRSSPTSWRLPVGKSFVPNEVVAFFGTTTPTWSHVKRVCKILRSELWIKIRLCHDWLKLLCFSRHPHFIAARELQGFRRTVHETTEAAWNSILVKLLGHLRKPQEKDGNNSSTTGVLVVGGASVPDDYAKILGKGPKYGVAPRIPAHELAALNRRLAGTTNSEQRERCLLEERGGVKLGRVKQSSPAGVPLHPQ
ncbi:hypothetical protein HPB52_020580 [Rhipicephalus sanguineus]|uniref:Uncharacterized protein n=1 Tax=Rhipicephalus sanguineus TaxID=34632 RepID=A0A9D4T4C1_RHISA|nr:hypothetical protein HPB52_020580 [Rhipicephalus sanguineus]